MEKCFHVVKALNIYQTYLKKMLNQTLRFHVAGAKGE